jgi:hypothetical protein
VKITAAIATISDDSPTISFAGVDLGSKIVVGEVTAMAITSISPRCMCWNIEDALSNPQ